MWSRINVLHSIWLAKKTPRAGRDETVLSGPVYLLSCCAVGELSKFFGLAFSALVPLVNPLGDALVFLGLVGAAPPGVYRTPARKIAISTTLFLLTIELVGTAMLQVFWYLSAGHAGLWWTRAGGHGLKLTESK